MIPTLIVFGLVFGRWWRITLLAAAVGWPLLLVAIGIVAPYEADTVAVAAIFAVINTAVGVLPHQVCLQTYRLLRRRTANPVPA
jgi:hypothetical protein